MRLKLIRTDIREVEVNLDNYPNTSPECMVDIDLDNLIDDPDLMMQSCCTDLMNKSEYAVILMSDDGQVLARKENNG